MYKFIYINRLLQTSVKAIFFFPAFFRGATMKRRWALKAGLGSESSSIY